MKKPTTCHFFCVQIEIDHLPARDECPDCEGSYQLVSVCTLWGETLTVWIYVDTGKQVGDTEHIKVFANQDAAETWFEENDSEGVAFQYTVLE
jgi:hypothetical protein